MTSWDHFMSKRDPLLVPTFSSTLSLYSSVMSPRLNKMNQDSSILMYLVKKSYSPLIFLQGWGGWQRGEGGACQAGNCQPGNLAWEPWASLESTAGILEVQLSTKKPKYPEKPLIKGEKKKKNSFLPTTTNIIWKSGKIVSKGGKQPEKIGTGNIFWWLYLQKQKNSLRK